MNDIPTALTIQRNTQDKKHLREMLKLVSKVIPETPCSYSMPGQIQRGTGKGSGISITTI